MPTLRGVVTFNVHKVWPKTRLQKNNAKKHKEKRNTKTFVSSAAVPTECHDPRTSPSYRRAADAKTTFTEVRSVAKR